jgi:hypothetical protein
MSKTAESWLPKLVVAPGFILGFAFIYGFMIWNGVLSVSASRSGRSKQSIAATWNVAYRPSNHWSQRLDSRSPSINASAK